MHHLALSSQDPAHRPSATRPVGPALPDRRPAARARHSLLVQGYPGLGLPHGCGSYPGALSRYLLAAPRTREPYAVPARTPVDGGPLCACCSPPRAPGNPSRFRPGPGCSPRLRLLVPGDLTRWRIPHRPLSPVPARCPVGQGNPLRFRPGHGWALAILSTSAHSSARLGTLAVPARTRLDGLPSDSLGIGPGISWRAWAIPRFRTWGVSLRKPVPPWAPLP